MAENGMETSTCTPHLTITVDEHDLTSGAVKILTAIRPTWKIENIEFKVSSRKKKPSFVFHVRFVGLRLVLIEEIQF